MIYFDNLTKCFNSADIDGKDIRWLARLARTNAEAKKLLEERNNAGSDWNVKFAKFYEKQTGDKTKYKGFDESGENRSKKTSYTYNSGKDNETLNVMIHMGEGWLDGLALGQMANTGARALIAKAKKLKRGTPEYEEYVAKNGFKAAMIGSAVGGGIRAALASNKARNSKYLGGLSNMLAKDPALRSTPKARIGAYIGDMVGSSAINSKLIKDAENKANKLGLKRKDKNKYIDNYVRNRQSYTTLPLYLFIRRVPGLISK